MRHQEQDRNVQCCVQYQQLDTCAGSNRVERAAGWQHSLQRRQQRRQQQQQQLEEWKRLVNVGERVYN
jgi:hypothetical protein